MIRKTAFLVTGTVTGLVAVLSYNPPKLSTAIAASGSTTTPSTTGSTSTNSATNPATTSPTAATTNTPVQPQATKSSASKTSSSTSSSSNTSTQNSTTTNAESPAAAPTPTPTPTPAQKQSSGSSGTYKGETVQTRWGPVQVQVTLSNGKITDISTLQYPNGDRRSQMISNQVIPWLQQEALQAQSANISGIGGATYTSRGFINSLASALQKAGL
jgi:uncharacterized protein with FMN-binding domain